MRMAYFKVQTSALATVAMTSFLNLKLVILCREINKWMDG